MAQSSINATSLQIPNLFIFHNYETKLKQSTQLLIAEIRKGTTNSSHFVNTFYELMQAKTDPPLETIWVYSALSFRGRKTSDSDFSDRISAANELFRRVSGVSAPCNGLNSIALLAPVVTHLFKLVAELLGEASGAKKVTKMVKKVKSLVEVIVGYVSLCCCNVSEESDLSLVLGVEDLVSVWMDDGNSLDLFFPLVSDGIRREITSGEFTVSFLAGVVIAEVFLLKLCLDLRVRGAGEELEGEMRSWAVGSMTGFKSFYFFETLVKVMLEPTLPVTSILNSGDEILLRTILYDAIILVEYSFLGPARTFHLPAEHVRSLAIKRLIITNEAIKFFRKAGNQKRAISYTSSFSNSRLPSQIVEDITSQIDTEEETSRLKGSSPKALLKWLLFLESRGIRLFADNISKHLAKLVVDNFQTGYEQPAAKPEGKKADPDLLFYIDNKGDEEEVFNNDKETTESMSAAFIAASHTMSLNEIGGRKRKMESSEKKKRKFLKYGLDDDSDSAEERLPSVSDDGSNSESEVENPSSEDV